MTVEKAASARYKVAPSTDPDHAHLSSRGRLLNHMPVEKTTPPASSDLRERAKRGRPKRVGPEFWFCKSEHCARSGICDDPLFCTQIDFALQSHARHQRTLAGRATPEQAHDGG